MAKGKKCPKCGNYTMHEKRPNHWYCSKCGATTFGKSIYFCSNLGERHGDFVSNRQFDYTGWQ